MTHIYVVNITEFELNKKPEEFHLDSDDIKQNVDLYSSEIMTPRCRNTL